MAEAARKLETVVRKVAPTDAATDVRRITLLELVAAIADSAETDAEVIATVAHLINTKQVELIGNFCDADVEVS